VERDTSGQHVQPGALDTHQGANSAVSAGNGTQPGDTSGRRGNSADADEMSNVFPDSVVPQAGSDPQPEEGNEMSDRKFAEALAQEDEPRVITFERFRAEDVVIDPTVVDEINKFCRERGEPYVDPQFPPLPRSLYLFDWEADHWECAQCHTRSRLPPVPPSSVQRRSSGTGGFLQRKCKVHKMWGAGPICGRNALLYTTHAVVEACRAL